MIFHDVEQNSDEWMKLRLAKATGSNFSCFMANYGKAFGEPAKKYALRIALERINGFKSENGFTNEHMERGHEQEPIARMMYEDEHFAEVTNGGFFDCGLYGDSPDGLVGDNGVIEIKSVIETTHYATLERKSFDPAYKWQLVGHLDCTSREWVDFISYCADFPTGKQLIVYRLHRHEVDDELTMLDKRRKEFLALVDTIQNNIEESVWQA
tara:strand:+ start:6259 stop:6891 length:633 start_codon:yes stop_codon:yes gene_type:complete